MTFTNISRSGIYLTCCHREVAPGGRFFVSWDSVKSDPGLRSAMRSGGLAWVPDADEADFPESPAMPDLAAEEAARAAEESERRRADEEAVARKMREDDEAVSRNMSRMGNFAVPTVTELKKKVEAVSIEVPVTEKDLISDGSKPASLADIKRHNRAVKRFSH